MLNTALPPGLLDPITTGFDARRGEFCGRHVFRLTYAHCDPDEGTGVITLRFGNQVRTYSVPDGFAIAPQYMETIRSRATTVVSYHQTIYKCDRSADETPVLSTPFRLALAALPASVDEQRIAAADLSDPFVAFFRAWGTHYLVHGVFGASDVDSLAPALTSPVFAPIYRLANAPTLQSQQAALKSALGLYLPDRASEL
jgi:hypothetical protein